MTCLPAQDRRQRRRRVKRVRQADTDHVDLAILDQFAGVGELFHFAILGDHSLSPRRNQIRYGNDLEPTGLLVSLCMLCSGPSGADDADA